MKTIVYTKYGSPDVLQVKEVEKPIPKKDEVLIKVHGAGVTKADCEMRSFNFQMKWFWLPFRVVLGLPNCGWAHMANTCACLSQMLRPSLRFRSFF